MRIKLSCWISIWLFCAIQFINCQYDEGNSIQICRNSDSKFKLLPHEKYCDYYYRCSNNEAILTPCPHGLVFAGYMRGRIEHCGFPYEIGCPDGIKTMGQKPLETGTCPWKYGTFAHETSCTKYWQCWNGTETLRQCPYELLYNEQIHACDWPQNVPDCQKHPLCKDTPNGAVPIDNSCDRYWLCVGGYPRFQRCPAGLAFNLETKKCDYDFTVPGCEPVDETNNVTNTGGGGAAAADSDPVRRA